MGREKAFRFKQFSLLNDKTAMKVGTDGVLLGCWCDVSKAKRVLDVGTGCGLIALMIAQRQPNALIYGIDIEEYNEEYIYEEDEPVDLDNLKEIPDFSNISFNKIEELTKNLNNDSCHIYKRSNENLVYTFVE